MKARQETERLAAEEAKIQAEKDSLMNLSEKELLVEAVMALRGLYSRVEELEEAYDGLNNSISCIKKEISSVKVAEIRKDLEMASSRLQKL